MQTKHHVNVAHAVIMRQPIHVLNMRYCHARSFLSEYASTLNWKTTTALLESYGRLEELESFAAAVGRQEELLEYLMRNPRDGVQR